ncbi:MAG: ATP-binding protein [candidate division WOR-3 bacterium]
MVAIMPFPSIICQERAIKILDRIIYADRFLPLLFVGQSGIGKRTLAIKFAQTVNCEKKTGIACGLCKSCRQIGQLVHPDLRIIFPIRKPSVDSSPDEIVSEMMRQYPDFSPDKAHPPIPANYVIPIGAIRWLASDMAKPPVTARKRFYIILHAHRMNTEAQNALLKILEEPHPNTVFILTAVTQYALLPTIRSRCQVVRFANISEREMIKFINQHHVVSAGDRSAETYDSLVANLAQGSLGRALRIYSNPDEYIVKPLIDFIDNPNPDSLLALISELKDTDPALVMGNTIQMLNNRLRAELKSVQFDAEGFARQRIMSAVVLLEKLAYFYERYHLTSLNLNPTLSAYTTLSQLLKLKNQNWQDR